MTSAFADVRLIIIILLALIPAMSTAPGSKALAHQRLKKIQPWSSRCGELRAKHPNQLKNPKIRHQNKENKWAGHNYFKLNTTGKNKASPKPLRRIRYQIGRTCTNLHELSPRLISQFNCNEVPVALDMNFDWAPKNLTVWYKEHVKCLNKTTKVNILLPYLHEGLQNFSAKLQELLVMPDTNVIPDCDETREELIKGVAEKCIHLLCEVERTIMVMGVKRPRRLSEPVGPKREVLWSDFTYRHLYEWGVLFVYQVFLDDWNKIIRHLVGRKGDRRCKQSD